MQVGIPLKSLDPAKLDSRYDAIVIGSGIGGLSTAATLAKEGQRVLVLERHYTAGGFTHTYARKGFEWDVGVHYIGEVHKPRSLLRRVFDYISDYDLKWSAMDDVYDRIVIGNNRYDLIAGRDRFLEKIAGYFPSERTAIARYLDLAQAVRKSARHFFMAKALSPGTAAVLSPLLQRKFKKHSRVTTLEVLRSLTRDKELIAVLTGQYGDYGLPPAKSSFAMHALVATHYLEGANYPAGGSAQIARSILPVIQGAGGDVIVGADVDEVIVHRGKAVGIRLKDGREIHSEVVISSAGFRTTVGQLLRSVPDVYGEKLTQVVPSVSHICVYAGLKQSGEALGFPKTNLWVYPHNDHDKALRDYIENPKNPIPLAYISFPSVKDPDWQKRFANKATVEVVGFAPYNLFRNWEHTAWRKRGKSYEQLKDQLKEDLLEKLYQQVPQVRGAIAYSELSTPLSTRHFMNYQHGEIYGLAHTPSRFEQKFLNPRSPIKNLFLAGQDIATAGVSGGLISGVLCASSVLNRNMLVHILKSTRVGAQHRDRLLTS